MKPLRRVIPFPTTYLGRPANTQIFMFNCNKLGPRVAVVQWLDNGEAEVRACKGDGCSPKFKVFEEIKLNAVDAACTDFAKLASDLADKHFA